MMLGRMTEAEISGDKTVSTVLSTEMLAESMLTKRLTDSAEQLGV